MKTKVFRNRFLLMIGIFFLLQAGAFAEERWVNATYVKGGTVDPGSTSVVLAVRSGPGMDYSLVGRLSPGQKVISLEARNG